jgi:hypothetical protein
MNSRQRREQARRNRANSQHSKGPKTEEGKAVAAMNALADGLTARKTVVLKNESQEEYEQKCAMLHENIPTFNEYEYLLVDRMAICHWRLARCFRVEEAITRVRVSNARYEAEHESLVRAEELGRRIVFEPFSIALVNNHEAITVGPYEVEALAQREQDVPRLLLHELCSFADGADWLIDRWERLRRRVVAGGSWTVAELRQAARMLGRQPEETHDDPVVASLIIGYFHAFKLARHPFEVCEWLRNGFHEYRVEPSCARVLARLLPEGTTPEQGRAHLVAIVDAELDRLRALKSSRLDALREDYLASAAVRAEVDDTHAGKLRRRYETGYARELRGLQKELAELQAPRLAAEAPPEADTKASAQGASPPEITPKSPPSGFVSQRPARPVTDDRSDDLTPAELAACEAEIERILAAHDARGLKRPA